MGRVLGIVASRADSASMRIADHLLEMADWSTVPENADPIGAGGGGSRGDHDLDQRAAYESEGMSLRVFEELHIELDGVDEAFDPAVDLLAVASRHAGDTGPLLSAHHTGNFGPAAYGGAAGAFARAAPGAHKRALETLREVAPEEYEVATECTHHGPTAVETPLVFCELGSDEAQWADDAGARAVARAILSLTDVDPNGGRTVVGFGGGHYANRFRRIAVETDWAVGHVGAAWSLEEMGDPGANREVLRAAMDRSKATHAVVDGRNPTVETVLDEMEYQVVSETWVRESSGVARSLVTDLEARLESIDEGLRFGEAARAAEPVEKATVVTLPEDLLAEAQGIDRTATVEAVRERALAFETEEGATRIAGRVALPDSKGKADLTEALVEIVAEDYDRVEREAEAVVVYDRAFDPERARELGVTDGPAFGRLAAGESVEVDGRTITAEEVHREREQRFSTI